MRQVQIQLRAGGAAEATRRAADFGAVTLSWWRGHGGDGTDVDILSVSVPNASLGDLLTSLEEFGPIEATLPATGSFSFEPPRAEPPKELVDVTPRSPVEIFLAGQQSAGSWKGFVLYAVTGGIVAWIGLYTETLYLLTASMLLAPFAGPAMNTAIAVTTGDRGLLKHSVMRYLVGVSVTAVTCSLLTLAVGQHRISDLTADVLSISAVAVLLPVAAGVAGANHLVQSEHSSLVSGAAVGMLVAASLAPPTAALGIAVALARWDLVAPAAFLVALQLVGITLTAAVLFRLFGLSAGRGRFQHGSRGLFPTAMTAVSIGLVALVAVQFATTTSLQTRSLSQTATEIATDVVRSEEGLLLLEVTAGAPSEDVPGPTRILIDVAVEVVAGSGIDDLAGLEDELAQDIRDAIDARIAGVGAAVDVVAHPPRDDVRLS